MTSYLDGISYEGWPDRGCGPSAGRKKKKSVAILSQKRDKILQTKNGGRTLHEWFPCILVSARGLVSARFICSVWQWSGTRWQNLKAVGASLQKFPRSLIARHVEWCNARNAARQLEWGQKREGEGRLEDRVRRKAETEGDSKGLITAYHLEYNLYHTNLQWDCPYCWRMITEMKGLLVLRLSERGRSAALTKSDPPAFAAPLRQRLCIFFSPDQRFGLS